MQPSTQTNLAEIKRHIRSDLDRSVQEAAIAVADMAYQDGHRVGWKAGYEYAQMQYGDSTPGTT